MSRKIHPALAQIRLLCSLGLPITAIADELAMALRAYLPSELVSFFLPDEQGRPVRMALIPPFGFDEEVLLNMNDDFRFIHELERRTFGHDTFEYFGAGHRFQSSRQYGERRVVGSPMDEFILHPTDVRTFVRAAVPNRRGCALLYLARPPGERHYSEREEAQIGAAIPYLAHVIGLSDDDGDREFVAETGLVVTDRQGEVQYLCPVAKDLRLMIAFPEGFYGVDRRALWLGQVRELAQRLERLRQGEPAPPPAWDHQNAWGRFVVHARPLNPRHAAEPLVAIKVRRFRPVSVRLATGLAASPLTERQRQAALLIARGFENREAARRLNVSVNTIGGMVKEIFLRMQVNDRASLRQRLLAGHGND